jgi:hypothetical protein
MEGIFRAIRLMASDPLLTNTTERTSLYAKVTELNVPDAVVSFMILYAAFSIAIML